ncbi:hypothetical protein BY458DRAFT_550821 [Sporodiniella umbellata]|nr:hypothetical protein BY458DRAFT_550821 [Sporodiniella umbellata]
MKITFACKNQRAMLGATNTTSILQNDASKKRMFVVFWYVSNRTVSCAYLYYLIPSTLILERIVYSLKASLKQLQSGSLTKGPTENPVRLCSPMCERPRSWYSWQPMNPVNFTLILERIVYSLKASLKQLQSGSLTKGPTENPVRLVLKTGSTPKIKGVYNTLILERIVYSLKASLKQLQSGSLTKGPTENPIRLCSPMCERPRSWYSWQPMNPVNFTLILERIVYSLKASLKQLQSGSLTKGPTENPVRLIQPKKYQLVSFLSIATRHKEEICKVMSSAKPKLPIPATICTKGKRQYTTNSKDENKDTIIIVCLK